MEVVQKALEEQKKQQIQDTFRQYAEAFFVWETCPRVQRRLDEGKSIGRTRVRKSRRWLELYALKDPIFPGLKMGEIRRADFLDLRNRFKEKAGMNTVNKVIATVKTVLAEAYFCQEIEIDPGSRIGNIQHAKQERGIPNSGRARLFVQGNPRTLGGSTNVLRIQHGSKNRNAVR